MNPTIDELHSTYTSKDTDELITLYRAGTLTDEGYLALELVLKERDLALPSRPEYCFEETYKPRNHLSEFWHGKKSLKSTFWLICILGNVGLLLSVIIYAVSLRPHVMAGPLLAYIIFDTYMFVSVWRSSKQSIHRAFKVILLFVSIVPLTLFLQLISLGLSTAMHS